MDIVYRTYSLSIHLPADSSPSVWSSIVSSLPVIEYSDIRILDQTVQRTCKSVHNNMYVQYTVTYILCVRCYEVFEIKKGSRYHTGQHWLLLAHKHV